MPKPICSVPDCGRTHNAQGYCHGHYFRLRKFGHPMVDVPLRRKRPKGMTPEEAFRFVMPGHPPAVECWEWPATRDGGDYGLITYARGHEQAHRVAHKIFIGPVPDELQVCHDCDNPPCVNPNHLYAGTSADNHRDMVDRNRSTKGALGQRGQVSPVSKLTDQQAEEIRRRYVRGVTRQVDLAEEYGVKQAAISRIVRRVAYTPIGTVASP